MAGTLSITFGQTVTAQIDGHSHANGATIPDGSTVTITSSDPTVATVGPITVPAGGAASLPGIPVTVLAAGSTTLTATVAPPGGTALSDTATLTVTAAALPLDHVSLTLTAS